MKRLQFSLASLLGLVLYAAAWCAIARSDYSRHAHISLTINSAVWIVYLIAGTATVCSRTNQPFWGSFCLWGIVFMLFLGYAYTWFDAWIDDCTKYAPIASLGGAVIGGWLSHHVYRRIRSRSSDSNGA